MLTEVEIIKVHVWARNYDLLTRKINIHITADLIGLIKDSLRLEYKPLLAKKCQVSSYNISFQCVIEEL